MNLDTAIEFARSWPAIILAAICIAIPAAIAFINVLSWLCGEKK